MASLTRRDFFRHSAFGLAAAGGGALVLRAGAQPTPAVPDSHGYLALLEQEGGLAPVFAAPAAAPVAAPQPAPPQPFAPTEDNILGPYYRAGAPYRAKVTPPLEPGTVLVVRGRVWGHDTRRPLPGAVLDIWQANAAGRYDNDDPAKPPAADVFVNRTRVVADESGHYEFETVHPGRYRIGPEQWRPSHIHYLVQAAGYRRLVTQLYFKGDPMNDKDDFIRPSLIIALAMEKVGDTQIERGVFDIVLAKAE